MKKSVLFLTILIFSIVCLSIIQVVISNGLSTSGILLDRLEKQIAYYEKENYTFQERLYTASSLTHIASAASDLGFVNGSSKVVLTSPLPMALKQ